MTKPSDSQSEISWHSSVYMEYQVCIRRCSRYRFVTPAQEHLPPFPSFKRLQVFLCPNVHLFLNLDELKSLTFTCVFPQNPKSLFPGPRLQYRPIGYLLDSKQSLSSIIPYVERVSVLHCRYRRGWVLYLSILSITLSASSGRDSYRTFHSTSRRMIIC